MRNLIAEDLLLLLLDDDSGVVSGTSFLATGLGGAVLLELALAEDVTVEEKTSMWRSAKVRVRPGASSADPALQSALVVIAERERTAQDLVNRLGKGLRDDLAERLAGRGILERRETKILGLFPRTVWPTVDASHERDVRAALTGALVEGREPDDRTRALVSLLSALDRAHKVVDHPGLSNREVRKRAKELAEGEWAAKAVKDVIASANAAVTAALAGSAAAAAASS